jgi:hypothetical protein
MQPPPPPPPPPPQSFCSPLCAAGQSCVEGRCADVPAVGRELPQGSSRVNEAGERAPVGQHYEHRRRTGFLIAGPILLGVGWLGGAFLGILNWLGGSVSTPSILNAIPFAGPLLGEVVYSRNTTGGSLLFAVALTAMQVAGTVFTILGLPMREVLIDDEGSDYRDGAPRDQQRNSKLPPIQWSVAPGAPGAPLGVSLTLW